MIANGQAFKEVIDRIIPECSDLGVGLHLNITDGRSLRKIIPRSSVEKKNNYNHSKQKLNSEFDIKHKTKEAINSLVFLEIFN